jgi:hypothetical protein
VLTVFGCATLRIAVVALVYPAPTTAFGAWWRCNGVRWVLELVAFWLFCVGASECGRPKVDWFIGVVGDV